MTPFEQQPLVNHEQEARSERLFTHHYIETEDPYLTDPEKFEYINSEVERLSAMGYEGNPDIDLLRPRKAGKGINYENPPTAFLSETLPGFNDWFALMPTAAALDPLYDPTKELLPNGSPMTSELADWLTNLADGRGIRSRAELVRNVMIEDALEVEVRPARWLSLACGAAQPIIKTAALLAESDVPTPEMTLVDRDSRALRLAKGYAEEAGVGGQVVTRVGNVLRASSLVRPERLGDVYSKEALQNSRTYGEKRKERLEKEGKTGRGFTYAEFALQGLMRMVDRKRLPAESFDIVEAVGLTEYLKEGDWPYTYDKVIDTKVQTAGAVSFMRNAYELVRPGGSLIVGNMLDTHPQLGFTLNVIQWPHIQPRSTEEMMNIFDAAGVEGQTDVYTAQDGVYAIYRIKKI